MLKITVDQLTAIGTALYGSQWQSALARDLGVADRTMRRWVAGESPIPTGIIADLHRLLRERQMDIKTVLADLPQTPAPYTHRSFDERAAMSHQWAGVRYTRYHYDDPTEGEWQELVLGELVLEEKQGNLEQIPLLLALLHAADNGHPGLRLNAAGDALLYQTSDKTLGNVTGPWLPIEEWQYTDSDRALAFFERMGIAYPIMWKRRQEHEALLRRQQGEQRAARYNVEKRIADARGQIAALQKQIEADQQALDSLPPA